MMKQAIHLASIALALALLCACGAKASARLDGTWVLDEAATLEYLSNAELDQTTRQSLSTSLPLLSGLRLGFNDGQKRLTMSLFGHDTVTSYGLRNDSKDKVVVTDPTGQGADLEITFLDETKIVLSSADLGILVLNKAGS